MTWAWEEVGSREGAPAVPVWEREKGASFLALGAGAGRSWVSLEAGGSWKRLSWLPGWVLTAILASSRVHARRGSVGFESKVSAGGWFTWNLAPPSAAGLGVWSATLLPCWVA